MSTRKTTTNVARRRGTEDGSDEASGLKRLKSLIVVFEEAKLGVLEYADDKLSVKLVRGSHLSQVARVEAAPIDTGSGSAESGGTRAQTSPDASLSAPAKDSDAHIVKSPFVGTFYRSPRPGAPAFVEVQDHVRRGQTLCIVEAMKLMNEIESEIEGTVLEVLVENGKPVQYGDALIKIKKS